jgi:hypothetical protein
MTSRSGILAGTVEVPQAAESLGDIRIDGDSTSSSGRAGRGRDFLTLGRLFRRAKRRTGLVSPGELTFSDHSESGEKGQFLPKAE